MPPKSTHEWRGPRPRQKRTTAVVQPPPIASSNPSSPVHCTSTTKKTPLQNHATIPAPPPPHEPSQKALPSDSGLAKSDDYEESRKAAATEPDHSKIEHFGPPEKIIHVEAENVEGSGSSKSAAAVDFPSVAAVIRPPHVLQDKGGSVEPGGASGVAGRPGNGKRRIVKKKTIVKKKVMIKRRVLKRVFMDDDGSENQGAAVKEDGENSREVLKSSNLGNDDDVNTSVVNEGKEILNRTDEVIENLNVIRNDVIEKPNGVEGVTEKTSIVVDEVVVESLNLADEPIETMKLVDSSSVKESNTCETGKDLSGIHSVETEASEFSFGSSTPEQMVLANEQSSVHTMGTDNIKSNDLVTEVDRNDLNVCIQDSMDVEKINDAVENSRETEEIANTVTDNQAKDFVENQDMDIVNKVDVELVPDQNVGSLGEKSGVLVGEQTGSSIQEPKTSSIRLNEGLLLSGEMEALERKKRRKTHIFVGGLDKDAKEDDIKNAFGEAGAISEVKLVMNDKKPGKNKGFAFVRFATAADAKNALEKYSKIEICGKQIDAAPVEGNDTLYLGNIDRSWKTEDVVTLLGKAGIKKIDKVTLKADPRNVQKNRGFAFVELETSRDAQIAFNILQKKDIFGKNLMVNVEWAQSIIEPAEEELLKVKSVYAEYLPSSWDKNKVNEYFKRFGEIENVVLAKDLPSSKRKDFSFIEYKTRDAALTCIEAVGRERLADDSSKVKMAVSLANPTSKKKQMKSIPDLTNKQLAKSKQKAAQNSIKLHEHWSKGKPVSSSYDFVKVDNPPSTTDELVQLLRQQASKNNIPPHSRMAQAPMMHIPPHPRTGSYAPDHHFPLPGSKRPFLVLGHDPVHVEPQGYSRLRMENSYSVPGQSSSFRDVGMSSFPYHRQQEPGFAFEPFNERRSYPRPFQTRERAPYFEDNGIYRRY